MAVSYSIVVGSSSLVLGNGELELAEKVVVQREQSLTSAEVDKNGHSLAGEIYVEFLEINAGERLREVVACHVKFARSADGLLAGQDVDRLLNLAIELAQRTEVVGDVKTSFLLVLLDEVVDETAAGNFTHKIRFTSRHQDLEDIVVNGKKGDVECSNVAFVSDDTLLATVLVKTASDGGSSRAR